MSKEFIEKEEIKAFIISINFQYLIFRIRENKITC